MVLLGTWRKIAAAQLLEWIAYRIPPGVFETPGRLVAGTWKIGGERRAEKIISARTRFRHARACSCPIMRGVWTRQRKNHAEKVRRKSAFIRKPLAEPWTQTLDISNDFQEIQQADLFSYVKSQGNTDKSKAWKKALSPTPTRRPPLLGGDSSRKSTTLRPRSALNWESSEPPARWFLSQISGLCHRPGMRSGFPGEEFRSFSHRRMGSSPPHNSSQTSA